MITNSSCGIIVSIMIFFVGIAISPLDAADNNDCYLNVKDFGAVGDGKTDDTKAIQAAFTAVTKHRIIRRYNGNGMCYISAKEVLFPAGHYKISKPITIPAYCLYVRGIGNPAIEQTLAESDIFYGELAWQSSVRGLTFLGGKTQLSMGNPNMDKGKLTVEDCRFFHSSGPAIVLRKGSNSTQTVIRNCLFAYTRQALINYCDFTVLADCWISSDSRMSDMAVIVNARGQLTCRDIVGVPGVGGIDQRWIDNHATLRCIRFRFGGEHGGFTPVVNYAKYRKDLLYNTLYFEGCEFCGQSNLKRKAAVYCEEIPNSIEIRNSDLLGIPPIKLRDNIDLKTYFCGVKPSTLKFSVRQCLGEFADEIPAGLLKPTIIPDASAPKPLSDADAQKAMQAAIKAIQSEKSVSVGPGKYDGHIEQIDPANYIDIKPDKYTWDCSEVMDGTDELNSDYVTVGMAGDDIILLRRIAAGSNWPHVTIRNVEVDLDKTPYLSWKLKDFKEGLPNKHAVKVVDRQTGAMVLLGEIGHGWQEYLSFNLKDKLKVTGKRKLDIRFYYLGTQYIPPKNGESYTLKTAKAGDYMVLDFMRLEK